MTAAVFTPFPGTVRAGIGNHFTASVTVRASLLNLEKTATRDDLAHAAASGTSANVRAATLGTGPLTSVTVNQPLDLEFLFHAGCCFFQGDLQIVAQIGAALATLGSSATSTAKKLFEDAAAAAATTTKYFTEDVKRICPSETASAGRRARSVGKCSMPVAIVGCALLVIGEDVVGFSKLFKLLLRLMIVRILIRMILDRELAIGLLDLRSIRIPGDTQHFVIIAFFHLGNSEKSGRPISLHRRRRKPPH